MNVALVGALGVVVGALLTMQLQYHNWIRQECLKAYGALLSAGIRECEICKGIDFDAAFGNEARLRRLHDELPPLMDSPFMQLLTQCWLLERNSAVRQQIDAIEERYKACRDLVVASVCLWKMQTATKDRADHPVQRQEQMAYLSGKIQNGVKPEEVQTLLDELKRTVAAKYSHSDLKLCG